MTEGPLSNLDLRDPNGVWRLYVTDDHPFDAFSGLLLSRFELQIQTRPFASLELVNPTIDVDEGSSGELIVRRSAGGAPMGAANVAFTNTPGTAGPDDYRQATVSFEFAPGETEKRVRVEALADAVSDPDESFELKLARVSGDAKATGTTTATVRIRDVSPGGGDTPTGETPRGSGGGSGGEPVVDRSAPRITGVGPHARALPSGRPQHRHGCPHPPRHADPLRALRARGGHAAHPAGRPRPALGEGRHASALRVRRREPGGVQRADRSPRAAPGRLSADRRGAGCGGQRLARGAEGVPRGAR